MAQSHHCGRLNATAISDQQLSKKPLFDHARHAAAASKPGKVALAAQMDWHETARSTPGQARTATSEVQHGTITAGSQTTVLFRFHARHGAFYLNILST
jgi:hypothetical protein